MEHKKLNFVHKDDSIFSGAIFMSNRVTKRECLRRNLFGLPQSKAKFLKQVKAGMILFLFEHEERKLYGVFEATSDGALNIIPDAFKSTGQLFPAQILFKRIWICRPLCEDEFRSAIGENYYSPNKFHFGLSYEQVTNLIHLFYIRKINLKQDRNSATDEVRLTEVGTYVKSESDDYSREGKLELRRQYALPQSSMDVLMHHKSHATSTQHTVIDIVTGSNQLNLRTLEAQLSYPQHSYSETVNSQQSSVCLPNDHVTINHFPIGEQHTTAEMEYNKPLPRQSACHTSSFDDMSVPYNPEVPEFNLSCNSMIPRFAKIQEADLFKSLHVVNDDCLETAVLQRTSVYGAQPNQLFEFPDYIPLPEEPQQSLVDRENQKSNVGNYDYVSSTALGSCIPSTCKKISIAFDSIVANIDDDGPNPYPRMEANDSPVVTVDGQLHSDTDLSRASVFSRLSRDQNVYNPETPDSSAGLSREQLFCILAERRERWSVRKVFEDLIQWGSNEQYNCTVLTELFDQSSGHQNNFAQIELKPVEGSNNDVHEGITKAENAGCISPFEYEQSEDLDEGSFELPFYNFRRRNTSQKGEVRDDLNACSDVNGSKATVAKSKRRRILRPSLHQEKQNANGEAEMKKSAQMKEETRVNTPTRAILEYENDNQDNCGNIALDGNVPSVQPFLKSDPEGESVEVNHATSEDGSEDYIPIG